MVAQLAPALVSAAQAQIAPFAHTSGFFLFGGAGAGVSYLQFPHITEGIERVGTGQDETIAVGQLGFPLGVDVGAGYKTNLQLEYRRGIALEHAINAFVDYSSPGNPTDCESFPRCPAGTLVGLNYSVQELLFKGSLLNSSASSLYIILGRNESRLTTGSQSSESMATYGQLPKGGFDGGGLTTGIEYTYWCCRTPASGWLNLSGGTFTLKRSSQSFASTTPFFLGISNAQGRYDANYWSFEFSLKVGHTF
jgi:hypothetical protein